MLGDKLIENTYTWVKYSLGILYLLTLFGIWSSAPKYLKIISFKQPIHWMLYIKYCHKKKIM